MDKHVEELIRNGIPAPADAPGEHPVVKHLQAVDERIDAISGVDLSALDGFVTQAEVDQTVSVVGDIVTNPNHGNDELLRLINALAADLGATDGWDDPI